MHFGTTRQVAMPGTHRAIGVALVALLFAWPAHALRCTGGLVSLGDHQVEVLERCGEPVFVARRIEYPFDERPLAPERPLEDERAYGRTDAANQRLIRIANLPVQVEEWVYDLGNRRFRQLLRFRAGRLIDIESIAKPR